MSERIYRRLLRLYPAPFRDRFAEPMLQLFRDQRRDAGRSPRPLAHVRFWLGILFDTLFSALRERVSQWRQAKKARPVFFSMRKVPSFRFLFFAFLIPVMTTIVTGTLVQPRGFTAISRMVIHKPSLPSAYVGLTANYDPYFVQMQFESIKSGPS